MSLGTIEGCGRLVDPAGIYRPVIHPRSNLCRAKTGQKPDAAVV